VAAGVAAWLAAVAAATVIGITAVNAIGSGIVGAGETPLSPSEVDARLSATPSVPTTPTTTTTAAPPPATSTTSTAHAFPSQGGTVIARCAPDGVEVLSATPAQGYQVSSSSHEIDDHPSVRFTSGRTEVEVRLRCVGDTPQPEIRVKN
jgi:hypothetical protein